MMENRMENRGDRFRLGCQDVFDRSVSAESREWFDERPPVDLQRIRLGDASWIGLSLNDPCKKQSNQRSKE